MKIVTISFPGLLGRIKEEIMDIERGLKQIHYIGIPLKYQKEIGIKLGAPKRARLQTLFGIRVRTTKYLSITTLL